MIQDPKTGNASSLQAFDFICRLPVFRNLPEHEVRLIADQLVQEKYAQGISLGIQSKTRFENIYIIKDGELELFFEQDGEQSLKGNLTSGDVFGGIGVLVNNGVAVRTAVVRTDATVYALPASTFLEVCNRHEDFADHFLETFYVRMLDEDYASSFKKGQIVQFLSGIPPFSFLPEYVLRGVANQLAAERSKNGTLLFVQGSSRVDRLYIIKSGAVERFNEIKGEKKLLDLLGEGDVYGGISMLVNNGLSVRTVLVREDTLFYTLPKAQFLKLCQEFENFSEFFTDTFGKRMIDRSYAAFIKSGADAMTPSAQFFNLRVQDLFRSNLLACSTATSIQQAASAMSSRGCSSIFVQAPEGDLIGVVTDTDLRKKVISSGLDPQRPVVEIMSSPLCTIEADAMVSEAVLTMMDTNVKHLGVTDKRGKVVGVLTNSDILLAQEQSPFYIIRELASAGDLAEIIRMQKRAPGLVHNLINSGAKSRITTRLISKISDSIMIKLIGFALAQVGPAPVPFTFIVVGSEGRSEQTLKTDQDNAIVFADVPVSELAKVTDYFLQLGQLVCTWLDQAGYAFCKGNIMAMNPKWCKPLSEWKNCFRNWIRVSNPQDLLEAPIFFDFRAAYGDTDLADELRLYLFEALEGGFFKDLALNALEFKPPIGFFRNFVLESKGEHRNKFDLKNAMIPIVDFARIYALKHNISDTNTQERLYHLNLKKVLSGQEYEDLDQAYNYLMQQRLLVQINNLEKGEPPENFLNPKKLSRIEQTLLKEIFKRIEGAQRRLTVEFTGVL